MSRTGLINETSLSDPFAYASVNPYPGCTRNCPNCCAKSLAALNAINYGGIWAEVYDVATKRWTKLHRYNPNWKRRFTIGGDPRRWLIQYLGDICDCPLKILLEVLVTVEERPRHHCLLLTQEPLPLVATLWKAKAAGAPFPSNLHLGVTVTNRKELKRIDVIRNFPYLKKEVWLTPLRGSVKGINLKGIHRVHVSAEIGHGTTKLDDLWVREVHDACGDHTKFYKTEVFDHNKGQKSCAPETRRKRKHW